jgi:hypothetical protein
MNVHKAVAATMQLKAVRAYRLEHPKETWEFLFETMR